MSRTVVAAVLIAALAVPVVEAASTHTGRSGASLAEKRWQLQRLLSQLTQHQVRLRQVRRQEHKVLDELDGIDRSKEEAERRLAELSIDMHQSEAHGQATATKLVVAQQALASRRERLRVRMREIYRYGRTGYVDVLLGAGDVGEFVSRWRFVSTAVSADSQMIDGYAQEVAHVQRLRSELLNIQARLSAVAAETRQRRKDIEARGQTKRTLLRRLQEERTAYERVVRELEQNSRDLGTLIRRMQTSPGHTPGGLARGSGRFIWPARGLFTSGFGLRRHPIFGIRRMHTGIDIAAGWGAPVIAAADGRVLYTGWFGGYGKIVILDHGGGLSTLYAHLSDLLVSSGDDVRRGQPIGRVGSTGYSTGPHVHFEIRVDGSPVDPTRP